MFSQGANNTSIERASAVNFDTGLSGPDIPQEPTPWFPSQGTVCNRIYEIFDNPNASFFSKYISFFIIVLIAISSIAFVLETLPQYRYPEYGKEEFDSPLLFQFIETVCVLIFTVEYGIRILCVPWLEFVNNEVVRVNIGTMGLNKNDSTKDDWISATITKINTPPNGKENYDLRYQDAEKSQLERDTEPGCAAKFLKKKDDPRWIIQNYCCVQGQRVWKFFWDPLNLIDFLAIIPYYFGKVFGESVGSELTILRILRLLRVLRLFKLAKYVEYIKVYLEVVIRASSSFVIVFIFIGMSSVLTSALVFFCEKGEWSEEDQEFMRWDFKHQFKEPTPFKSILHTMWWAIVTFTTTGYGDYYPTSSWGRVLGAATMMLGVIGLAMPISAINQVFHEVMEDHNKKKRTYRNATIEQRLQRCYKLVRKLNGVAEELKWLDQAESNLSEEEYLTSLDLWNDDDDDLCSVREFLEMEDNEEVQLHVPSPEQFNQYTEKELVILNHSTEYENNNNNRTMNNQHYLNDPPEIHTTYSPVHLPTTHQQHPESHYDYNLIEHSSTSTHPAPPSHINNNPEDDGGGHDTSSLPHYPPQHSHHPHNQPHHIEFVEMQKYPPLIINNHPTTVEEPSSSEHTYESSEDDNSQHEHRSYIYDDEETSENQFTIENETTSEGYDEDREISAAALPPPKIRRENTREKLRNLPTPKHMTSFV